MAIKKSLIKAAEALDWSVNEYSGGDRRGDYVELESHSPAGENVIVTVDADDFVYNVREYANGFDVDEHIEMWVRARGNTKGVPSIRELVEDADRIQEMLNDLADALEKADVTPELKAELKVSFEFAGEGISGDYNPDNPNDVKLLRLYILSDGEAIEGASTCTQFEVGTAQETLDAAADYILERAKTFVDEEGNVDVPSVVKLCEAMSWMGAEKMDPLGEMELRFDGDDIVRAMHRLNLSGFGGRQEAVRILREWGNDTRGDVDDVLDIYVDADPI